MVFELENKIRDLIEIIDRDSRMIELRYLEEKLLDDKKLLRDIQILQQLDRHDPSYLPLKTEIFENADYCHYQKLENEINFLILEINQILKQLIEKSDY
ncbi:MAG: hypothetical protein PUB18_05480 [bacterium]|nr:hypothetical protein [bacterium]